MRDILNQRQHTMLGAKAAAAETALRQRLNDPSGAVQIAAAEALAHLGKIEVGWPVLERWLRNPEKTAFALQAANVLDRLGERARPVLPFMKRVLKAAEDKKRTTAELPYPQRMIQRIIDVLEGRIRPLFYPPVE